MRPSSTHTLALSLLLARALAACQDEPDVPPATMIPNPTAGTGTSQASLPVLAGGCARLAICCAQVIAATGGGSQSGCAQITSMGGNSEADRACDLVGRALASSVATLRPVPPACGLATVLTGTAVHGAVPGRALAVGAGMSVGGTLEAGDGLTADGSAYDDYVIPMVSMRPVTIVARGGPLTSGGGTMDMYVTLMLNGAEVTHDDDSAGSLNSRIVFTPTASAVYVIRVSTYGSGLRTGTYNLEIYDGSLPNQT